MSIEDQPQARDRSDEDGPRPEAYAERVGRRSTDDAGRASANDADLRSELMIVLKARYSRRERLDAGGGGAGHGRDASRGCRTKVVRGKIDRFGLDALVAIRGGGRGSPSRINAALREAAGLA